MADDITRILKEAQEGDGAAMSRLLEILYSELRNLAGAQMRTERASHTLQATALVHEAYLRLVRQSEMEFSSRAQFFGAAAKVMRNVLVSHARKRNAGKRGGARAAITLDQEIAAAFAVDSEVDLLALDAALARLERDEPEVARVVEMRFFAGMTEAEVAAALGTTDRTVRRHWSFGKAWLFRELSR